jgi:hypothetical protein
MASSSAKTLLSPSGLSSFRRFLQDKLPALQQSPILLISSEPANDDAQSSPHQKQVAESTQLVQFTLAQQFGLRTVPSSISSAFPTVLDMEERFELLRRTGASSVVAVGSGAAMDLAKAMPFERDLEHLILVPSTYAAVLASSSSHSLFLDPVEETLVPSPTIATTDTSTDTDTTKCTTTIVPLDVHLMAPVVEDSSSHVLYASMAIILDACYRKSDHPLLPEMLTKVHDLLDASSPGTAALDHDTCVQLLYQSGKLLSYGLGSEDRSIPIALSASLIPRIFPHVHALTLLASLVPGLCHVLMEDSSRSATIDAQVNKLVTRIQQHDDYSIPQLTVADESLEGFSVPDMALSHIRSNQTVWNCLDVPDATLTEILQHSMKKR